VTPKANHAPRLATWEPVLVYNAEAERNPCFRVRCEVLSVLSANDTVPILPKADALLRHLFAVAMDRLRSLGITMCYTESVIDWLLRQPDWQDSPNPLRSLDGCWHQQISAAIEKLLLESSLQNGDKLVIGLGKTATDARLQLQISSPAPSDGLEQS
jgi:hypothetical protein